MRAHVACARRQRQRAQLQRAANQSTLRSTQSTTITDHIMQIALIETNIDRIMKIIPPGPPRRPLAQDGVRVAHLDIQPLYSASFKFARASKMSTALATSFNID